MVDNDNTQFSFHRAGTDYFFALIIHRKRFQINRWILVHFTGNQKDHENSKIQLLVVVNFRKQEQNRKSDDAAADDIVHKWCSQSLQSSAVKLWL